MITEKQLPFLLKLLDDKEPATQAALKQEFAESSGDISNELAALAIDLSPKDQAKLSQLLLPGRRTNLVTEWQIPSGGATAISEDWDSFEHHLRIISDFLHDGISLRPSLPDMVDMLTQEAQDQISEMTSNNLRKWMFEEGKFKGNEKHYYLPENSDICWVADHGLGNPLSLATLFILVGHRLDLDISGCNYPGHFLARIFIDSKAHMVDCFHGGRLISSEKLLAEHKELSLAAKMAVKIDTPLGHILWRFLRNLEYAFTQLKRPTDAKLFDDLAKSLH